MGSSHSKKAVTEAYDNYEEVNQKKPGKLKARLAAFKSGSLRREYNYNPQRKGYEFSAAGQNKFTKRRWHSSTSLENYPGNIKYTCFNWYLHVLLMCYIKFEKVCSFLCFNNQYKHSTKKLMVSFLRILDFFIYICHFLRICEIFSKFEGVF